MASPRPSWNIDLRSHITLAITSIIIATVVIAFRVPSCSESFWVDELHTVWTIHDDLADVLPRAQIGHQQPYYFGLLWLWRQTFGESELALRMTSVLSVAIASVILNVAVGGGFVGFPTSDTPFPQIMLVDYVRVYEEQ